MSIRDPSVRLRHATRLSTMVRLRKVAIYFPTRPSDHDLRVCHPRWSRESAGSPHLAQSRTRGGAVPSEERRGRAARHRATSLDVSRSWCGRL